MLAIDDDDDDHNFDGYDNLTMRMTQHRQSPTAVPP